uniref:Putative sulfide:quinone oxidoreductase/flavo-binding protein n=1 Tax=Ixodes ricinus TaxID=34613 RepID=A0A0K8RD15_IXORI
MIKGLEDALKTPNVCSNYSYKTVTKTFSAMQNFNEGTAIFTYPATPAKCPGAAQKVMYLTDAYLRKVGQACKAKTFFIQLYLVVLLSVAYLTTPTRPSWGG